jgi:exosome complex component RRP41
MIREDGRGAEQLRPLTIRAGVVEQANGSAIVSMGRTTAMAAVYGPRALFPKHLRKAECAVLQTIYNMVPFSTQERVKPGHSRRAIEICKVTRHALEPAIFLEDFPKAGIDVYIDIIQADAGTRTAGINAAATALADAGIPMRDLVAAVAVGKIGGKPVLDLTGKEEEITDVDMPVAYMPRTGHITLLQMDGNIPPKDVRTLIELAIKGCQEIYRAQKEALRQRWIQKEISKIVVEE